MTADPKARLIALLTERPEYRQAYDTNADFRAVVQSIVNLIPPILAVAYENSQQQEKVRSAHTQRLMGEPSVGFGYIPSA